MTSDFTASQEARIEQLIQASILHHLRPVQAQVNKVSLCIQEVNPRHWSGQSSALLARHIESMGAVKKGCVNYGSLEMC